MKNNIKKEEEQEEQPELTEEKIKELIINRIPLENIEDVGFGLIFDDNQNTGVKHVEGLISFTMKDGATVSYSVDIDSALSLSATIMAAIIRGRKMLSDELSG